MACVCGFEQATASLQSGLSGELKVKFFALIQLAFATPACAFSLFYLFDNLSLKKSKRINLVASTTFGIYLFHDADLISNLMWNKWLKVDTVQYSSYFFPFYCIVTVATVFLLLSLLDLIRQQLEPWAIEGARQLFIGFKKKYSVH